MTEDIVSNQQIGKWGREVVPKGARILTYCNAGALATADYGTAVGVIRAAFEADPTISVFSCETRPFLQGARLTVFELMRAGIPVTLITDNAVGSLMSRGKIDVAVVGADRIAANGDTANKIGTYMVAVLARTHDIPFYVAAPRSTIDPGLPDGSGIPIEQRDPREVTHFCGKQIAPEGVNALNPAFDVTPNKYISGIITEVGVLRKTFRQNDTQGIPDVKSFELYSDRVRRWLDNPSRVIHLRVRRLRAPISLPIQIFSRHRQIVIQPICKEYLIEPRAVIFERRRDAELR